MLELNEKHKLFADEYIKTLNATESYYKIYGRNIKETTANSNASRLLRNAKIKEYIDNNLAKIKNDNIADVKEILEFLTKGMRMEQEEEVVVTESVGDFCSEARIIKKQIPFSEARKCAELLGKRYRMFIDKVEIEDNREDKLDTFLNALELNLRGK